MGRPKGSVNKPKACISPAGELYVPVDLPWEEEEKQSVILCGWVNICKAPATRYAKEAYYTGSGIYETKAEALAVVTKTRVGIVYIECEVKE